MKITALHLQICYCRYHITEHCGPVLTEHIWRGQYTIEAVKRWTRELLRAVDYLHEKNVIIIFTIVL